MNQKIEMTEEEREVWEKRLEWMYGTEWEIWNRSLPQAEKIYKTLFGEPKTHREWANRFNIVGQINRIILKQE